MSAIAPVFYVDDDKDDLDIFLMAANSLFIETRLFDRGEKMLKALLNPPPTPSIIFIDINMPLMTGYQVISEIKEITDVVHVPLVVLSTAGNDETIRRCMELGVDYFIQKPTSVSYLIHAISYVSTLDWNSHDPKVNFVHEHTL